MAFLMPIVPQMQMNAPLRSLPPSDFPSFSPSFAQTSKPTDFPSFSPSFAQTSKPIDAKTLVSSLLPSLPPSDMPSILPTFTLSDEPTHVPSFVSQTTSSEIPLNTTFYAIGDVPYDAAQAQKLTYQMQRIPATAEFVIHVGDIRNATAKSICRQTDYADVASILRLSKVPVFVILGDNDWNDCDNPDVGLSYWKDQFMYFESRYWDHSFNIERQPDREENFSFRHKGSLFIGLNLVGGYIIDDEEWTTRLQEQANWTIDMIRSYQQDTLPRTGAVVLFGHAKPSEDHDDFFNPFRAFIEDELQNSIPILYLHGDDHYWRYNSEWLDQSSLLRIMVSGEAREPPLKVEVYGSLEVVSTSEAFLYDRDLENRDLWNSDLS